MGIFVSFVRTPELVSRGDPMKILLAENSTNRKKYSVREFVQFSDTVPMFEAEITGSFLVSRKKEDLFHLEGELTAAVVSTCDRCGCRIEYGVQHDFFYHYHLESEPVRESDYDGTDENCEDVYLVEPVVETVDVLKEQLLLAMPQQSLCGEQCKGLCNRCGMNLNENQCKCSENNENSPFAILKKLQNN